MAGVLMSLERGSPMALDWKAKADIHRRDDWTCAYCDFRGHDSVSYRFLSVDHVTRRADGGGDESCNLVTACIHCNLILNQCTLKSVEDRRAVVQTRNSEYERYFH